MVNPPKKRYPSGYDMKDEHEDENKNKEYKPPKHNQTLKEALNVCKDEIWEVYDRENKAAVASKYWHRNLAVTAAACGTVAVLFAILQLATHDKRPPWLIYAEIAAILVAFAAISAGLAYYYQKKWLFHRHVAERCRLLKYRSLIDHELWCGGIFSDWKDRLVEEMDEIKAISAHRPLTRKYINETLKDWLEREWQAIDPTTLVKCPATTTGTGIPALVEYLVEKRFEYQAEWFSSRAKRHDIPNRWTRIIPPALFFASVGAVLVHFIIDIFFAPEEGLRKASIIAISLAAAFPAIGAGFRIYRSAFEFARTALIFNVKHQTIEHLADELHNATQQHPMDIPNIFCLLWRSEQFLDYEHREWLHLMIESEWF